MLSKNEIKFINSLQQKKYRNRAGLFLAEGTKLIDGCIASGLEPERIYALDSYSVDRDIPVVKVTPQELKKISTLTTPNDLIAIIKQPKPQKNTLDKGLILVLDGVRDPGNLGTIIRLCDWFNVSTLLCSTDTVDCYNPKVVQATMGSIATVDIRYLDIEIFLKDTNLPIYYSLLDGQSLDKLQLPSDLVLVMGSESKGISDQFLNIKHQKVTIPKRKQDALIDSLNVATATAILLNQFTH